MIQSVLILELGLPCLLLLNILHLYLFLPCGVVQSKSRYFNGAVKCLTIQLGSVLPLTVNLVKLNDNASQLLLTLLVVLAIPAAIVGYLDGSIFHGRLVLSLLLNCLAHDQVVRHLSSHVVQRSITGLTGFILVTHVLGFLVEAGATAFGRVSGGRQSLVQGVGVFIEVGDQEVGATLALFDLISGLDLHIDWSFIAINFHSGLVLVVPIESDGLGIADHHLLVVIEQSSLIESCLLWHRIIDHLFDILALPSLFEHLLYPLHDFYLCIYKGVIAVIRDRANLYLHRIWLLCVLGSSSRVP